MSARARSLRFGVVVGVQLVSGAAFVSACHPSQAAAEATSLLTPPGQVWLKPAEVLDAKIEVQSVGPQVVEDSVLTSGVVSLDDQRSGHVFTPVTGRVIKILAQLGEQVKKGDPLATIESPDVGSAVSDAHKAEADLIAADHNVRRKKELFEAQAASEADVEASEDSYRNAKAELERAQQKQFLLRVGNVDAVTQTYTLAAPIDGEVLLRNITPGVEVQGQYSGGTTQELFTIGQLDRVWVLGDVYEIDIGRVHVGTPAKVTVLAYPDAVFEGRVDWVSGSLDPVTRTAKVRCTFENHDKLLRPSMYSTVRITVDQRKALAVPRGALLRLGEYKMVFVQLGVVDGYVRYERLPVEIVDGEGPWLEVTHGLDLGQQVVVSGAATLSQKI
jgi:cobalt-zinc-cadmium efflux system membrane fusion protein